MKKLNFLIIICLSVLFVGADAFAQSTTSEKTKTELKAEKKAAKKKLKADRKQQSEEARRASRDYARFTSLAEILRQQPGVIVTGTGQTANVQIRGMNSMQLDNRPLYVYDGIRLGRDYTQANNAIDRATIRSVRILSSLSETNFYGEDGRNGVIVIKSYKQSK